MKDHFSFRIGMIVLALLVFAWSYAIVFAPQDAQQGQVYKIIFAHVPAAATALGLCSIGLLVCALGAILRPAQSGWVCAQKAWAELGLIFTVVTLITGSVWGKPTWGTWWTWDARLTTTLILAIALCGYIILYYKLPSSRARTMPCSLLALMIVADVPIIYKSVTWWRTLHQEASLIATRGQTMDPEMLRILLVCIGISLVFCVVLWRLRFEIAKLEEQL